MTALARKRLAFALALIMAVGCHRLNAERGKALPRPSVEIRVEARRQRASEVETAVSLPVSRALAGAPHVARVSATSEPGGSTVTVQLDPGTDPSTSIPALRKRLDAMVALLPPDASAPVLARRDGRLVERYLSSQEFSASARFAWISGTEGVAAVTTCGNAAGDVTLNINADALASQGFTVAEVAALLASLRPLSSPALPRVVLGYYNGAPVRLGDVATMTDEGDASRCSAFDDQGAPLFETEVFALPNVSPAAVQANLSKALRRTWIERPLTEARSFGPGRTVTVDFDSTMTFSSVARALGAAVKSAVPRGSFILEIEAPDGPGAPPLSGRVVVGANDEAMVRRVTDALLATPGVAAAGEANATLELLADDRVKLARATAELCSRLHERGLLVGCPGRTPRTISVPEVDLDVARRLGVSMSDVALTLDAVRGRLHFPLAVVYAANASLRLELEGPLDHVYVKTRSGVQVPLSAFVKTTTESSPSLLQLENERPSTIARVHATDLSALKGVYDPPSGIELRVLPD